MGRYPDSMALTPQQERFAQLCVTLVNYSAAYRQAYNVKDATKFTTVANEASRLANDPEIAARIRQLQDEAAARSAVPTLAARIQELREMEQADPRQICGMRWVCCRFCHGVDHHYQWLDDLEYAQACDIAIKAKQPLPDMSGGFGYNGIAPPAVDCPRCWGIGVQQPYVNDITKLTGPAVRLYKGIKIKGNGDIEILLHDQMQARDMLNRIMGAYKDGAAAAAAGVNGAADAVKQAQQATTPEERQRNYLRVVSG